MNGTINTSRSEAWAFFKHSVVGRLLSSPPERGMLQQELEALALRLWDHPVSKEPVRFGFSTIETWYYQALRNKNNLLPSLCRKPRSDCGRFRDFSQELRDKIASLHQDHPGWTHRLHYDNLVALVGEREPGAVPSYNTIVRYRKQHGMIRPVVKKKFKGSFDRDKVVGSEQWRNREIRSFENPQVCGLWHCDFHHCSRALLHPDPKKGWVKPKLAAVIDDHSRLICHMQWYWEETAQNLVHTLMQAFLKCGLPRSLMSDNGGPMTAAETRAGLQRMGIVHETTLPYSPYQNGKQESFFGRVEGRLIPMLENVRELDLNKLNVVTLAWLEKDYQSTTHSEISQTPKDRFVKGVCAARPVPAWEEMEKLFCVDSTRKVRHSDGTIQMNGVRFEIPNHWRHFDEVTLRYASWNPSRLWLVDKETKKILHRLWPVNLEKNSDGRRRAVSSVPGEIPRNLKPTNEMAPLLRKMVEDYAATGLPQMFMNNDTDLTGE